jgi:hypothetical protein
MSRIIRALKRRTKKIFERIVFLRKKRILVIGDSHVAVFKYINKNHKMGYYFDTAYVSGATSLGIANPNSKTNALKIFKNKLQNTPKNTPVLIQMGEVDCGFVIWFLAEKKQTSVKEQFAKSIKNYKNFLLNELIDKGFEKIIVMSATLPTLKENTEGLGEIANLRKEVKATQIERTQLTLNYNKELKVFCETHPNLYFLEFDNDMLNVEGVIKKEFLNKDPLDHHNDLGTYSNLIVKRINTSNCFN